MYGERTGEVGNILAQLTQYLHETMACALAKQAGIPLTVRVCGVVASTSMWLCGTLRCASLSAYYLVARLV